MALEQGHFLELPHLHVAAPGDTVCTLDPSGQVSELDLQCFLVMCDKLCCLEQWPVTFALVDDGSVGFSHGLPVH